MEVKVMAFFGWVACSLVVYNCASRDLFDDDNDVMMMHQATQIDSHVTISTLELKFYKMPPRSSNLTFQVPVFVCAST